MNIHLLNKENIANAFTLPTQKICHHKEGSVFFDVFDKNKPNLLVTLGDSWTFGHELENRLDECFGESLSEKLDADWLNLGLSGIGNHYISLLFKELVEYIKNNKNYYKKIYCVVTLTETAREFNGWLDKHVDYATWLRNHITEPDDFYYFLDLIEKLTINNLSVDSDNIQTVISHNFVNRRFQQISGKTVLEKTWLEVCMESKGKLIDDTCYFVSPWIFDKLIRVTDIEWSLDKTMLKEWLSIQTDKANKRIDLLSNNSMFFEEYHPKPIGHQLWADYLYTEFKR